MKRREFITLIGGAAVAVVTISPVVAAGQDYPSRSITLIVNFPPGGSTDAMARIIREPLSQALGQSITIDNRGGAGGTTGAAAVANAKADGYYASTLGQLGADREQVPAEELSVRPEDGVCTHYADIGRRTRARRTSVATRPRCNRTHRIREEEPRQTRLCHRRHRLQPPHLRRAAQAESRDRDGTRTLPRRCARDAGPARRQRQGGFQHAARGPAAGAGRRDSRHRSRREDATARTAEHAHDRRDRSRRHQRWVEWPACACWNAD